MTKAYFTLFCREKDGKWYPQFGDYSRSVVAEEAQDSYSREYKAKDRKIIKHNDTPNGQQVEQAKLNGEG